jgi:hypothetical protein
VTRWLAAIVLASAFMAALVYATLREGGFECEVCQQYGGETVCRSVRAASRDAAIEQAMATTCAILAQGVTAGLECQRTPPHSLRCSE